MRFEKDARKTGVKNIVVACIVFTVLAFLQINIFSRPDAPGFIIAISWIIGFLVGGVFLWQGAVLVLTGGKWLISISKERVDWSSPNESIDKSFNIKITEIREVQTREKSRGKKQRVSRDYVLVLKNGSEIKLSPNSGINLVQVLLELERLGLQHEYVRT